MPRAFEECRRKGGNVRTETLSNNRYRHVCYLGKKRYEGEIHTKKQGKTLATR